MVRYLLCIHCTWAVWLSAATSDNSVLTLGTCAMLNSHYVLALCHFKGLAAPKFTCWNHTPVNLRHHWHETLFDTYPLAQRTNLLFFMHFKPFSLSVKITSINQLVTKMSAFSLRRIKQYVWSHVTQLPIFSWLSGFTKNLIRDKQKFIFVAEKWAEWGLQMAYFQQEECWYRHSSLNDLSSIPMPRLLSKLVGKWGP